MILKKILFISFLLFGVLGFSQKKETKKATLVTTAVYMREVSPLMNKKAIPEKPRRGNINPKRTGANRIVPGKGLPKGQDELLIKQKSSSASRPGKAPLLTYEANSSFSSPTDPTGAVGPNHYVSAKNSAYAIYNKSGNILQPSISLENIFPNESLGDPIVFYDSFADRFVITQFSDTPNGFLVAVCKGSDPVNDAWYTYRFNTGSFPDYTKFSIWSDGYYVTANKDQNSLEGSEIVFVLERDKMIAGKEDAKMIGFPLPGVKVNSFYSPAGFNATGKALPPPGNARIAYFQDDTWAGVDFDAIKLWEINVDWDNAQASTIAEAENLTNVTAFDSTFDGGSFGNLPQPGNEGSDLDVLQGAFMYASNYRRFCDYNTVLLNFAVDIDPVNDNISAIRWYELRQNGDNAPWTVYQEGTYASPDGKSAWCGSMGMDVFGNIGMGYTTMGTIANGATADSFVSIRYTGRLASDPLGQMTFAEQDIAIGTDIQRYNNQNRYGDYAQLTIDPVDDQTFWHTAEYFENTGNNARDVVGVFKIAESTATDVGVVSIDTPTNATFTTTEVITVTIQNFGSATQSNIPVSYYVNNGTAINETFTGSINPGEKASFVFSTTTDLTNGIDFTITAETNLAGDIVPINNCITQEVKGLYNNDVGVVELVSPVSGGALTDAVEITITLKNYGSATQSNIPVVYTLNNGEKISDVFPGPLASLELASHNFSIPADLHKIGIYSIVTRTVLVNDENPENDSRTNEIEHLLCAPVSDCANSGDGITSFELANVSNPLIVCNTGYENFGNVENLIIKLDKALGLYKVTVKTGYASNKDEKVSLWIDYNDNAIFENDELLLNNVVVEKKDTAQMFWISLDPKAPLGNHVLRIRAGDTSEKENVGGADLNDACGSMNYGTTHDYKVEIGNNIVPNSNLMVISEPNNQFLITMNDSNEAPVLRLSIFSILGQTMVSNLVKKDANGRFLYELDMSYASTGIYFVRLGSRKNGKTVKFIVN